MFSCAKIVQFLKAAITEMAKIKDFNLISLGFQNSRKRVYKRQREKSLFLKHLFVRILSSFVTLEVLEAIHIFHSVSDQWECDLFTVLFFLKNAYYIGFGGIMRIYCCNSNNSQRFGHHNPKCLSLEHGKLKLGESGRSGRKSSQFSGRCWRSTYEKWPCT